MTFVLVDRGHVIDQNIVAAEPFFICRDQSIVAAEAFSICRDVAPAGAEPTQPISSPAVVMDCSNAAIAKSSIDRLERTVRYYRGVVDRLRSGKKSAAAAAVVARCRDKPAHAGILVSLMRNQHHGSAASAAAWSSLMSRQLSRYTVTRWEVAAGTSIIASMALFHKEHERMMRMHNIDGRPGWCISITELIGDATKSKAWRDDKLQCLWLRQSYMYDGDVVSKECWPDVQIVDDGSAVGTMKIVHKQLRLCQNPMFDFTVASSNLGAHQLRFLNLCSDCGPDQVGLRRLVAERYRLCAGVIVLGLPCFMHQQSLSEGRVIARVDMCVKLLLEIQYYSSLVKLAHLFRNYCTDIYKAAKVRYGVRSHVAKLTKRKSPLCSSSRWDSLHNVEKYFLALDVEHIRSLISDVLFHDAPEQQVHDGGARVPVDDIAIDQTKHYKDQLTRWRGDVHVAIWKHDFWVMMRINHRACEPLSRFLHVLEQTVSSLEPNTTHLSKLVCGKNAEIAAMFPDVLRDPSWHTEALHVEHIFPDQMYLCLVTLVCLAAAEHHNRITTLLEELPIALFWLPEHPADIHCEQRQRVCTMVMQRQWSELDATTAKLFHAMPYVFEQGARDGTIQLPEWTLLQQWRAKCKCDAQIVESANSILVKMTGLAPRIDQQLLASRFTQKHELNSRGGGIAAVHAVLADTLPLHNGDDYKALCDDYSRWTDVKGVHAPVPLTDVDGVRARQPLQHISTPCRRVGVPAIDAVPWAGCGLFLPNAVGMSMHTLRSAAQPALRWARAWDFKLADKCFWVACDDDVSYPSAGASCFLCLSKLRYCGHWQMLSYDRAHNAVDVVFPFTFTTSARDIASTLLSLQAPASSLEKRVLCFASLEWCSGTRALLKSPAQFLCEVLATEQQPQRSSSS